MCAREVTRLVTSTSTGLARLDFSTAVITLKSRQPPVFFAPSAKVEQTSIDSSDVDLLSAIERGNHRMEKRCVQLRICNQLIRRYGVLAISRDDGFVENGSRHAGAFTPRGQSGQAGASAAY